MNKYDLSIIIASRNEKFLAKTVKEILEKKEGKTQIIVALDGCWANPQVPDHEDVILIHYPESIGQRACCNRAASLSTAKYIMKVDAHCGLDKGFDVKMMSQMKDNWTMAPIMKHLHAFDWVCNKCKKSWYQGPTPTECRNEECDNTTAFHIELKWKGKNNPIHRSFSFDSVPSFKYFKDYTKRPEYKKALEKDGLTESMSLQGSCWMLTRKKYWELNICDEYFGNWGSQGLEVAVKTWLSGGRVIINHNTWYAHMFRPPKGDFRAPYPREDRNVKRNTRVVSEYFLNNKYDKAIRPLHWLVEKFWPVPGWTKEDLEKVRI